MSFFVLYVLHIKNKVAMMISMAIYGGFIIPAAGVVVPFSVELCWPVPESHNNGFVGILNLAWGTLMSLLGAYLDLTTSFIFFGAQAFIAFICSLLIKEDLKRLKLQAVQESGFREEAAIKQLGVLERAEILERSGLIDQKEVQQQF